VGPLRFYVETQGVCELSEAARSQTTMRTLTASLNLKAPEKRHSCDGDLPHGFVGKTSRRCDETPGHDSGGSRGGS